MSEAMAIAAIAGLALFVGGIATGGYLGYKYYQESTDRQ
jgi:hypothetical protein